MMQRIVVTGMGLMTPFGGTKSTIEAVFAGRSAITSLPPEFHLCPTQIGGTIQDLNLNAWFPERIAKRLMERCTRPSQFSHVAIKQALSHAQLLQEDDQLSEHLQEVTGISMGTGIGASELIAQLRHDMDQVAQAPNEAEVLLRMQQLIDNHRGSIMKVLPDASAYQPTIQFKIQGPADCSIKACATGAANIRRAAMEILLGQAQIMLAGGTESLAPEDVMAFNIYGTRTAGAIKGALSRRNHDPQGASRPFDRDHDGFVPSEGAGAMVLETLESAKDRKVPILAELVGFGETTDAKGATDPDQDSQVRAMRMALNMASLKPCNIQLIKTHGTSTPAGDGSELEAIRTVFGTREELFIWAPKSMLGHTMGASGAIETVLAIQAMRQGLVPPTINLTNRIPEAEGFNIPSQTTKTDIGAVLCNSFGFGGQNVCLVFHKWQE